MSNLWTFGDSFTEGFNEKYPWADEYIKWKGYTPKVYGEILSEKLNVKLINKGKGGTDNYTIFETICNSTKSINDDDIIIIGWSSPVRFRLAQFNNTWRIFLPNSIKFHSGEFQMNLSDNTPTEIMLNRNSLLYVNEVNNWIELLNRTFKCNKIIHWSPLMEGVDGMYLHLFNRIKTETNEDVNNGHYGEKGHIELSNIFFEKIKSNKNKLI